VSTSCESSCPPLNPMAKSKYSEMNFEEFGGISRSLFSSTATMPSTKNKRAGFVRFSSKRLKFMNMVRGR